MARYYYTTVGRSIAYSSHVLQHIFLPIALSGYTRKPSLKTWGRKVIIAATKAGEKENLLGEQIGLLILSKEKHIIVLLCTSEIKFTKKSYV